MRIIKKLFFLFFVLSLLISNLITPSASAKSDSTDSPVTIKVLNEVSKEVKADPSLYNPKNPSEIKPQLGKVNFSNSNEESISGEEREVQSQGGVIFGNILIPLEGQNKVRLSTKVNGFIGDKPQT